MFATTIIAAGANSINVKAWVAGVAAMLSGICAASAPGRAVETVTKESRTVAPEAISLLKSNPAFSAECDSWLRWTRG